MTQQSLFKKSVATLIGFLLIISLMLCFAPNNDANADEIIWEQIDYEKHFGVETTEYGNTYGVTFADSPSFYKYKYLYVFIQGSGGMGGSSSDGNSFGYGGGSGAFAALKITIRNVDALFFILGNGGGTFEIKENDQYYEKGDGYASGVIAIRGNTETRPGGLAAAMVYNGKSGNTINGGKGGYAQIDSNGMIHALYSQSGADGGQASHSFSVDLGFRTEHFIYRPMGAYPSGKGGGASVFHRGGDGGVMFKNGSDGLMGAGGGGAGKGASQGGFGGDAYMEVYGSNM